MGVGAPPLGIADLDRLDRIRELQRIERDAKRERVELEGETAAMRPPMRALEGFVRREGFTYATWFRAFGTFGDLRDLGESPPLLGVMEELEDFDVPGAFYSGGILGKVKWRGVRELSEVMEDLNVVAPWQGQDFRDVYPVWSYRYYVAEMVGDVVVQIFEAEETSRRKRGPRA